MVVCGQQRPRCHQSLLESDPGVPDPGRYCWSQLCGAGETKELAWLQAGKEGLMDLPRAAGAEGKLCQPHTDS